MKKIAIWGKTTSYHDISTKKFFGDVELPNIPSQFAPTVKDLMLTGCEVQLLGTYEKG